MTLPSRKASPARRNAADRVLEAGVDALAARGLRLGLADISMEEAITASGVSRATAYRRWRTREAFIADVLVEAVKRTELLPEDNDDLRAILSLLTSGDTEFATEQGRRNLVVEGLRISLRGDIPRIVASNRWRTILSLSALHPSLDDRAIKDEVGRALRESEARFEAHREAVYRDLAELIGYRVTTPNSTSASDASDSPDAFADLAAAAGAMMRGIVLRALPDPTWISDRAPARLFGSTILADWSEPERMLARLLLTHIEPDPAIDWTPTTIQAHMAAANAVIERLYNESSGQAPRGTSGLSPDR